MEILRKKVSTYKGEAGRLRKIPDELALEILTAWEAWTGPMNGFYSALGVSQKKMAKIMGKAKRLKREGRVPVSEFTELTTQVLGSAQSPGVTGQGIELTWDQGKVIRFPEVSQLIDFLKKAA
ncbi:MAG: hypothetical protein KA715_06890 [Xanthomonadaceae bacterium]|nr:hypothetical protein [Xanthomonadaceae bacterium]MCM0604860.1 hypothetical protein [Xanthomonadaceae bacterium]MCM0604909.1 hypothetical protein [Xanthomonadaceae bacterium]MCM0605400.1 hypothetical protein [Xanthomonadaceae bacterium]MCM0605801.1 hypothetical protein [Xanthomonadaceae bacterium]